MAADLIIFDMDGVLLDSEPMHRELNLELFRELGADVSDAEYDTYIGMSTTLMWQQIVSTWGLSLPVTELVAREQARKLAGFRERPLTASVGLAELLRDLRAAGRRTAVASGSPRANVEAVLERLNLGAHFDYYIGGDEVTHGKPAPDLFLAAARYFALSPDHCAVIEDSANGIRAAHAAHMSCVGYQNPTSGHQDLTRAHLIVDSLRAPLLRQFLGLA